MCALPRSTLATVAMVLWMPSAVSALQLDQGKGLTKLDEIRKASLILGAEARGPGNERRIGTVEDLIIDGHGLVHYLLISPVFL